MIGWWIVVSAQIRESCDQASQPTCRAAILAQWGADADGICWIEHLTQIGKASKLAESGYPNRYTARAGDVLPLIKNGSFRPFSWRDKFFGRKNKIQIHSNRIAACNHDLILTIEAWDRS